MLTVIGQAHPSVFDSVIDIFSRLDTLAHPETSWRPCKRCQAFGR